MVIATSRVTRNFQLTLPKYIRKPLRIHEGDLIGFDVMKDGKITLVPLNAIDKDQAYYWTPKVQKEIALAEASYRRGEGKRFKSVDEARKHYGD